VALGRGATQRSDRRYGAATAYLTRRKTALRMPGGSHMTGVDAPIVHAAGVVVLLQQPRHAGEHRRRVSLGDIGAVGRHDNEAVRRQMSEQHFVEIGARPGTVTPGYYGVTQPTRAQVCGP